MQLVVLGVELEDDALVFEDELADVDVGELDVLADVVPELVNNADVVGDVDVLEEEPGDVTAMQLVVLDELADVDVGELDVLADNVPELVNNADVMGDVDVLEEKPGDVAAVQLVVLGVEVEDDAL
eukprot:4683495-Amphidinium_carterae.1